MDKNGDRLKMSKIKNPEYILCNKCNVHIRILSTRKDGTYLYSPVLSACPQCGGNDLNVIPRQKYDELEMLGCGGLWILVRKKYGKKTIKFSLKFEGLKDGLEQ